MLTVGGASAPARACRALALVAVLLASVAAAGCRRDPRWAEKTAAPMAVPTNHHQETAAAPSPLGTTPMVAVDVGSRQVPFYVQVATTPEEHANGLIGRPTLASDAGLLFVFDRPGVQKLEMKNSAIPLDMLFIGADGRIVGVIRNATPLRAAPYGIATPSRYVLEIHAGLASHFGFAVGQAVALHGIPGL